MIYVSVLNKVSDRVSITVTCDSSFSGKITNITYFDTNDIVINDMSFIPPVIIPLVLNEEHNNKTINLSAPNNLNYIKLLITEKQNNISTKYCISFNKSSKI